MIDSLIDKLSDKGICINDPGLMEEYGLSELSLSLSRNYLKISRIAARERGKGAGTRFMNDLADLADRQGWTLTLTPGKSMGATSVGRLQRFYRRFGFRPNKGRSTDFNVRDAMIRVPRTDEAFRAGNRARKKESAVAAIESVNSNIQAQINLLKKQTRKRFKKLEIKDGKPYYNGNLDLHDCIKLTSLPDGLTVYGTLNLTGCTGLTSLPDGLTIEKDYAGKHDLILENCTGLTSLPDGLNVKFGSINLKGCTELTSIPQGLNLHGSLDLTGCIKLTSLPDGLIIGNVVGGHLILDNCIGLTSLPNGLWVGGTLSLKGCTGLTSIPADMRIELNLNLNNCIGLTSLPKGLKVYSLFLKGCTGLTSLPDGLEVLDDLHLEGCTGLTSLPKEMRVLYNLYLEGCTGLTSLPADFYIACGQIYNIPKNLIPFFKQLKIKINSFSIDGEKWTYIDAEEWMKKRHLVSQMTEAFRAGNRARKKESAADAVDRVSAGSYMASVISLMKQKGYAVEKVDVFGDGRICSWEDNDDTRGYKLPDQNAIPEPQGWLFCWSETVSDPKKVETYMMVFDDDITQWQGILWPIEGDPDGAFWILEVDNMGFVHYNWEMYLNELDDDTVMSNGMTIGQYRRGILRDICGIEWPVNEAFRAGNRARKKESVQDVVQTVDTLKARIELFKKQTGVEAEIRDNRIYLDSHEWDLTYCNDIISLPDGLTSDFLDLTGCSNLSSLPPDLRVGTLLLYDCIDLTSLPQGLKVKESLGLIGCSKLESLPAGLYVGEDLELSYCPITSLPADLVVGGDLNLDYTKLTSIPPSLTNFKGNLFLNGCTELTSLPQGMTVGDCLHLENCTNLRSLPQGLTIEGDLFIKGCEGLTFLPADLTVKGECIWDIPKSLMPFIKRLGIKIQETGGQNENFIDIKEWMAKRHLADQVIEAFKAGNRARKKEAVQDTVEAVSLGCRNAEDVLKLFKDIADRYPDNTELLDCSHLDDKSISLGVYSPTVEYNGQDERITFEFDCDTPNNVSVFGGWARIWISTESYDESLKTSWDYFCDDLERNEAPNAYQDMFSEIDLETHMVEHGYPTMLLNPENTVKFRECIDRAFNNVNEAFKAGNRARKKESAFDFDSPFHTDGKSAAEMLTAMIKKMLEDDKWVIVENPQDTYKNRHLAGVVYIENTFVRGVRGYESGHMPKDMNFIDIFRLMPEGSKKSAEGRGYMKQLVQEWSLRLYVLGDKVWVRMVKHTLSGREHYTVRYNFQYEYPEWFTDETTLKNTFEGEIVTRDPAWQDFTEFSDRVWLVNTDKLSDFARMFKKVFADNRAKTRQRLSPKAYAKWKDSPSIVDQLLESRDLSNSHEPSVRGKRNSQDQETPEPGEISDEVSYLTDCPFVIPKESIMFFKLMQDAVEAHTITSPDEFITKARPNGLK